MEIFLVFILAFLFQYFLGFLQIKNFNKNYIELKKRGRVVIGKKKGFFLAGAIVLLLIDENANIVDARYMQGVTVFARFKIIEKLKKLNLLDIDDKLLKDMGFSRSLTEAILNGIKNYKGFVCELI